MRGRFEGELLPFSFRYHGVSFLRFRLWSDDALSHPPTALDVCRVSARVAARSLRCMFKIRGYGKSTPWLQSKDID